MRDIGRNIKQLRQMKNMTQDELAEKLFVTRQTVSNYETGKSRPDVEMLTQIAEVLGTDANTILYGIPQPPEKKRMRIKFCIGAVVLVFFLVGYHYLAALAAELARTRYDMRLSLLCRIILHPSVFFLFGWVLMQALGTFAKLSPLSFSKGKWIRASLFAVIVLYIFITIPILFLESWPWNIPGVIWYPVMYILGYLSNRGHTDWYLLGAFLLGCILWLVPRQKREGHDSGSNP